MYDFLSWPTTSVRGAKTHRQKSDASLSVKTERFVPQASMDSLEVSMIPKIDLENREEKYPLICHAEENAIMHAARVGVSLKDCTAYVTWPPCTRCARSLIQAGIVEVVYAGTSNIPERWMEDFTRSTNMMKEAGIKLRNVEFE